MGNDNVAVVKDDAADGTDDAALKAAAAAAAAAAEEEESEAAQLRVEIFSRFQQWVEHFTGAETPFHLAPFLRKRDHLPRQARDRQR